MELQTLLEQTTKGVIPLSELTSVAADRRAFGDDVLAAFRTQIELRSTAAQAVLDAAQQANRDTLLASEQRGYDSAMRERDSILSLQRAIEQRTESRNYVPPTQTAIETADADRSLVLTRSDKLTSRTTRPAGITVAASGVWWRRSCSGVSTVSISIRPNGGRSKRAPTARADSRCLKSCRPRSSIACGMRSWCSEPARVIVPMTSDVLHIARLKTAGIGSPIVPPVAVWKVENDPIAEGTLELERVTFTARTLPALIKLSVELSEDSANIDRIIETELSAGLARELIAWRSWEWAPRPSRKASRTKTASMSRRPMLRSITTC